MVLSQCSSIPSSDLHRFAWSGLRRFHHAPSVVDMLVDLHSISNKNKNNALKQANQIRHCLIQSREYYDASAATTLSTRPLLLYYSIMSLALAQILFAGTGADSLDAARGEHAHHGLLFGVSQIQNGLYDLPTLASALVAKPMMVGDKRRGTFELWHNLSREDPISGKFRSDAGNGGGTVMDAHVYFAGSDVRMGYLPQRGMSLLECLQGTPGMMQWLWNHNIASENVRGQIEGKLSQDGAHIFQLLVHPQEPAIRVKKLQEEIICRPASVDKIRVNEFDAGFSLNVQENLGDQTFVNFPAATMWSCNDIRFLPSKSVLNEFGYLYVGLYILGNYARYHPDKWMVDVEGGTSLALAAEEFLSIAEWRMALLTLSILSQRYFIPKSL